MDVASRSGSALLDRLEEAGKLHLFPQGIRVAVGAATCGMAAGAGQILSLLEGNPKPEKSHVEVRRTGCVGCCYLEPLLLVQHPVQPAAQF